ncbi:MAG: DUF255 domain-containing protein [FCB group bacterium]|nr:DUF255 domain-containing protein [FCB group bacterium]
MKKFSFFLTCTCFFLLASLALAGNQAAKSKAADKSSVVEQNKVKAPAEIDWLRYSEGMAQAKENGKKVFVEFTARWCGYCRKMRATTFKDSSVIALLNDNFVSVSVDGDSRDTLDIDGWITTEKKLAKEYRVSGYPTFWFLTPEGEKIAPVNGYKDARFMFDVLDYLKDDTYMTVEFKDYIENRKKSK